MMSCYKGKVALVTGASSGIGAQIVELLVKEGMVVVGAARRVDRLQELAASLKGQPGSMIPRKMDVKCEKNIIDTIKWIDAELGGLTVLVNDAAIFHMKPVYDLTTEEMKSIFDVNVIAPSIAIREAVKSFINRDVKDGYIININSTAGHTVPYYPNANFGLYPATKHAVTAIGEGLRQALRDAQLKVRVTSISPGAVATEMNQAAREAGLVKLYLQPEDVARSVVFALSLPLSAEITELTIRPTGDV